MKTTCRLCNRALDTDKENWIDTRSHNNPPNGVFHRECFDAYQAKREKEKERSLVERIEHEVFSWAADHDCDARCGVHEGLEKAFERARKGNE